MTRMKEALHTCVNRPAENSRPDPAAPAPMLIAARVDSGLIAPSTNPSIRPAAIFSVGQSVAALLAVLSWLSFFQIELGTEPLEGWLLVQP